MSDKDDEVKGPSRRQTVSIQATVDRTAKIFAKAEGAELGPKNLEDLRKRVASLKRIGDRDSAGLNALLTGLAKQNASSDIRQLMRIYLAQKLYVVVAKFSEESETPLLSKLDFRNIKNILSMDEGLKKDFIQHLLLGKFDNAQRETIFSHLVANDVLSIEKDRKLLEGINKGKPSNERVKSLEVLSLVRDIATDKTKNPEYQDLNSEDKQVAMMRRLRQLTEDPSARRAFLSELKTSKYKDNFENIKNIINQSDLSDKELFELMVHYSDNKDTWGEIPEDYLREKLDARVLEHRTADPTRASSIEKLLSLFDEDKEKRQKPSLSQVVQKEWLNPLQAFGLTAEKGTRWTAVTSNIFSEDIVRATSNREMMMRIGNENKLWNIKENNHNSPKEIAEVNWARVLNPFVMINYGLTVAEMFVNRGTQAFFGDEHPVARGIVQAPLAFILRVPRLIANGIGTAISKPIESLVEAIKDTQTESKKPTEPSYSDNEITSLDSDLESIEGLLTPRSEAESRSEEDSSYVAHSSNTSEEEAKKSTGERLRATATKYSGAEVIRDVRDRNKDERSEAMSTKADEEKSQKEGSADVQRGYKETLLDSEMQSEEFAQNLAQAVDLQAGNADAGPDEEGAYESYLIGEPEEVAEWKAKREDEKQTNKESEPLLRRDRMASPEDNQTVNRRVNERRKSLSEIDGKWSEEAKSIESEFEEVSLRGSRASTADTSSRRASLTGIEKGTTTKQATWFAALWQSVKKAWSNTSFRFGTTSARTEEAKKADTIAVKGASAGGVAKREFNEVMFVGFSQDYAAIEVQKELKKWHSAFESQLKIESGSFESPPIRFAGGQSILVKDNDVIMRGFSKEMYEDFNTKVFVGKPPAYRISAASSEIYENLKEKLEEDSEQKSLTSRLTSVALFFQKLWSDAKDFVLGTASAPEIKPVSNTTRTSSASSSVPEATHSADKAKTRSQSVIRDSTSKIEAAKAAKPRISAVEPTAQHDSNRTHPPIQRQETSEDVKAMMSQIFDSDDTEEKVSENPAKTVKPPRHASAHPLTKTVPGQSWVSVKVTVKHELVMDQKPDIKLLESTLNQAAEEKKLTIVPISKSDHGFQVTLNDPSDPKKGQIKFEASHTAQEVIITMTETKHSDSTLENMASIYTALPPEVQSNPPEVNGPEGRRTEFNQRVESMAKAKGPDKSEPPSLGRGSSED